MQTISAITRISGAPTKLSSPPKSIPEKVDSFARKSDLDISAYGDDPKFQRELQRIIKQRNRPPREVSEEAMAGLVGMAVALPIFAACFHLAFSLAGLQ